MLPQVTQTTDKSGTRESIKNTMQHGVTHEQLVDVAAKWLRGHALINGRKVKCGIVASEIRTRVDESPDAIGWYSGSHTVIVECKVSRSDYYRDKSKWFRKKPQYGAGKYRYYLTPSGLLIPKGLPEGWGLLEWDGKRVAVVLEATKQLQNEHGRDSDMKILASICQRLLGRGDSAPILFGDNDEFGATNHDAAG